MGITEFLSYWRVIKKRLWLILLLFIATIGVILATTLTAPAVYRATTQLLVIGSEPQEVSLFGTVRSSSVSEELAAVQAEFRTVLTSGLVAWRTIASLNLSISAADLLARISVVQDGDAMYVTAEADTPQLAEAIVNAHVEQAIPYYRDYRALPARVTKQFLVQQVDAEGEILAEAKDALLKFKLQNNVDSLERELLAYQDIIRALKTARDSNLVEEQRAVSEAASYRATMQATQSEMERLAPADTSATAASYREMIWGYQRQAADQDALAEGHKVARQENDRLIGQKEAELLALISISKEADALARAVALAEANYNFVLSKANEAQLKEATALGVGYIQVVEKARAPDAPAKSNLPRLIALGSVASVLFGIILAFVLEFLEGLGRAVATKERGK